MKVSVIIPIYNEEENIPGLCERLCNVFNNENINAEIIFIDDGSVDHSLEILKEIHEKDRRFKILSFSRNFGHQIAVTAGLERASGDAIIVMDGDLQDPPEVLPQLIAKWQEGYDVVYAVRRKRKEGALQRFFYRAFYRALQKMSSIRIPLDAGDFCIMSRRVVDVINALPEHNRFVRGLRSWAGFQQIGLEYERNKRDGGETKYNFFQLLKLAFDGIFSFSHTPLKIASAVGFLMSLISFIGILIVIYLKLFTAIPVKGISALAVMILFLGGIQLTLLGVSGEYIARIHDEVKRRALYVVRDMIGFNKKAESKKYDDSDKK